jgi:hypothetical protein
MTEPTGPGYSQISSRQFFGSKPCRNILANMPWCRWSARNAWQIGQRVRRLSSAFVPSLPLLMWSMCATSMLISGLPWQTGGSSGDWHRPPSLSQTRIRVTRQISRGWRRLGIFKIQCRNAESTVADTAPVTKTDQQPGVLDNLLHFATGHNRFVPQQMKREMPTGTCRNAVADVAGLWSLDF